MNKVKQYVERREAGKERGNNNDSVLSSSQQPVIHAWPKETKIKQLSVLVFFPFVLV